MRALQIERFGTPAEVLKLVEVADAAPGPGEVRVRVEASGINPSDVGNVNGKFPQTTFPRIVGRDFAGTIADGPPDLVGLPVWGSGGDIGFTRDGSHAEFVNIPAAGATPRPSNLPAEEAASLGVPLLTAWSALDLARLESGEWVIVSGAAGAVGTAVIDLAHAIGARVIALVKDEDDTRKLDRGKVNAVATSSRNDLEQVVRDATSGQGANVALNGIGASVFAAFLNSLAVGGRLVVYSVAFGGRETPLDLFNFYRKQHQIFGLNTIPIDVVRGAKILAQIAPLAESGNISKPSIGERYTLAEGVHAYERVGSADGKVVLRMA